MKEFEKNNTWTDFNKIFGIDYVDPLTLFKKYIEHVRQCEGIDFIDRLNNKMDSEVIFTDQEIEFLKGIQKRQMKPTIKLRYDLITAHESGIVLHPQKQMEELGYDVLNFEGVLIGDCIIITVDKIIEPLPEYLTII